MGVQVAEYKNQQTCFNVVTKTNNNHPDNKMIAKASIKRVATSQAEHADLTLPPKSPIPGRVMGKGRQRTFSTSATISTEREPIIRWFEHFRQHLVNIITADHQGEQEDDLHSRQATLV